MDNLSQELFEPIYQLQENLNTIIIGQNSLVDKLIVTLLAGGHILVEGPPGVAKTKIIKTMAYMLNLSFHRIQFTPDLLPSDITGSEIYNAHTAKFEFYQGPIFNDIILADEINRAPSKVQSALLEAMEERQVSAGNHIFKLSEGFMVMATQNPIEHDGTYPLPEAQLDRFLMKVLVDFPTPAYELQILETILGTPTDLPIMDFQVQKLLQIQKKVEEVYIDKNLLNYIVHLVDATRNPGKYSAELKDYIRFGASPRASISLMKASKALAMLYKKNFVSPDNIRDLFVDICRHRITLSFEALADNINTDMVCHKILETVPIY